MNIEIYKKYINKENGKLATVYNITKEKNTRRAVLVFFVYSGGLLSVMRADEFKRDFFEV